MSELWKKYVAWVDSHPAGVTELESVIKWISYGVSGRKLACYFAMHFAKIMSLFVQRAVYLRQSKNSLVITELLYKSGQVLGYINDRAFEDILKGSRQKISE